MSLGMEVRKTAQELRTKISLTTLQRRASGGMCVRLVDFKQMQTNLSGKVMPRLN